MRRRLGAAAFAVARGSAPSWHGAHASRQLSRTHLPRSARAPSGLGAPSAAAAMTAVGFGFGRGPGPSWGAPPTKAEVRQQERERAWRQFTAAMRDLRSGVDDCTRRTPAAAPASEAERREPPADPWGVAAERPGDGADWGVVDPATRAADPKLLAAVGVTDLEEPFTSTDATDGDGDGDGDEERPPAPVSPHSHSDDCRRTGSVPAFTERQLRQLQLLVTRACHAGLKANVAPAVVVQRILGAITRAAAVGQDKDALLSRFLLSVEGGELDCGPTCDCADGRRVRAVFAAPSVAALLTAEAGRLRTKVAWSLRRLQDSRSPATAGEDGSCCAGCGEPVILQHQCLAEHRHAEQLLQLFHSHILCEVSEVREGGPPPPPLPPLTTLEAGLTLCAAMQGGQGSRRAIQWMTASLRYVEHLLDGLYSAGAAAEAARRPLPEPSALLELVRGRLADCCCLALEACATGDGGCLRDGESVSFEESYALMMRYMSLTQSVSDLAAQAADAVDRVGKEGLPGRDASLSRSLHDTLTTFADVTLRLFASLAKSLPVRGHVEHFHSLRSLLLTLLTETDIGYDGEAVAAVQQCYVALLQALATLDVDGRTRHDALESLWRAVMLNSRSEVWRADDVHLKALCVLSAAASVSAAGSAKDRNGEGGADEEGGEKGEEGSEGEDHLFRQQQSQRVLSMFNLLMKPSSRRLAFREDALGAVTLAAPLWQVDADVQRWLSYHSQRYPLSMDIAHTLAVKLLLHGELCGLRRGLSHRGDGDTSVAAVGSSSSSMVYLVLDMAVSSPRRRYDAQAARTFYLRLLTLYRDLAERQSSWAAPSSGEVREEKEDRRMTEVLGVWFAELDAARVRTLPVSSIELMAAVVASLPVDRLPRARALLEAEMVSRAEGLLSLSARGEEGGPDGLRFASPSEQRPPRGVFCFPPHFSVCGCAGASSPWSVSDLRRFLIDVRALFADTAAVLTLRDFTTLMKLDRCCYRRGFPSVLSPSSSLPLVVPPGEDVDLRGSARAAIDVEAALGTRIPSSPVVLASGLAGGPSSAASVSVVERWLWRLRVDVDDAEGDAVLGGGDVGLSTRPLFPSLFTRVWYPAYLREARHLLARGASAAPARPQSPASPKKPEEESGDVSPHSERRRGRVVPRPSPLDEVLVTVPAER